MRNTPRAGRAASGPTSLGSRAMKRDHLRRCRVAPPCGVGGPRLSRRSAAPSIWPRLIALTVRNGGDRRTGMMRAVLVLAVGVVGVSLAGLAWAGPMDQVGYAKTVTCSACHGFSGNSRVEAVPILAGMAPAYFKKAIEDYATGKRRSPEMEPFAKQV